MSAEPITIREATLEDTNFLSRMVWEAILASPSFVALMGLEELRRHEEEFWQNWPQHPEPAFIAEDEQGQPVGALMLRANQGDMPGRSWRISIGVEEAYRGRRIGQLLIESAIAWATAHQVEFLNLHVDRANLRGLALYRRLGFTEKPGQEDKYVIEMIRSLI